MMTTDQHSHPSRPLHLRRWLPLLALLLLAAIGYGFGLHQYLSLATLAEHRDGLRAWVAGAALAEKSGPFVQKLSKGFAENAFSLLLFLRLTPVFPFWAVNAVAGLSRIPLNTFIAATALGIIPASFAFALIGSGLDGVIDDQLMAFKLCAAENGAANCHLSLSASALVSPELLWGLTGLGLVSLLPLLLRWWRGRRA